MESGNGLFFSIKGYRTQINEKRRYPINNNEVDQIYLRMTPIR